MDNGYEAQVRFQLEKQIAQLKEEIEKLKKENIRLASKLHFWEAGTG